MSGASYKVFKRLSSGGMAELFLGVARYDTGFRKVCAFKRILPEHAHKRTYIDLARNEALICQSLNHSNVVQVYGFDKVDGADAIIMEFVQGADLRTILTKCSDAAMPFSLPMALSVLAQTARALAYIHDHIDPATGKAVVIVHADVSPGNLLVSYDGEVKLTDFGVACARMFGEEAAAPGIRGKINYMAPEQMEGAELTPATDIFSLGCVVWEMLTGKRLLGRSGSDHYAVLAPSELQANLKLACPDLEEGIHAVVLKCLARNPRDRYGRAADLASDATETLQLHYPTYQPQRLGTFIRVVMPKEYAELQGIIHEAVNLSIAGEGTSLVNEPGVGGRPPAPPVRAQPAPALPPPPAPAPPPPPASVGVYADGRKDRTKIHRGVDLTMAEGTGALAEAIERSPDVQQAAANNAILRPSAAYDVSVRGAPLRAPHRSAPAPRSAPPHRSASTESFSRTRQAPRTTKGGRWINIALGVIIVCGLGTIAYLVNDHVRSLAVTDRAGVGDGAGPAPQKSKRAKAHH